MMLGPLNLLRRKHNPVHSALRRDIGICAGITAIVHTILGLQVHMGGKLSSYFVPDSPAGGNLLFVTTNYLGLIAAAVLLLLVLISNDRAIAGLGLSSWKQLQRLAYVAAGVAIVHGFIYQLIEKRTVIWVAIVSLVSIAVLVLQLKGRARRAPKRSSPSNPEATFDR